MSTLAIIFKMVKKLFILFNVCLTFTIICQTAKSQGTWTQKNDFHGTDRAPGVGFSIGTKGYILTVSANDSIRNDLLEWDQITNTWTKKSTFEGTPREGVVGFSIGTKGYIGTGEDQDSLRSDFWEWDQATDTWSRKADFANSNFGRILATSFVIGSKAYVGTGYLMMSTTYSLIFNDLYEWDQKADTWKRKADLTKGTCVAASFSIGDYGYVGTGSYYPAFIDFWEYCPLCINTGIEGLSNTSDISIYPNPFSTQTTLLSNKVLKDATLNIYNSLGQELKRVKNISGQTITINRNNLPSGLYYLQLKQDNQAIVNSKIIITDN